MSKSNLQKLYGQITRAKDALHQAKVIIDSWSKPCYKESLGYTCRHRTFSNGKKECGPN